MILVLSGQYSYEESFEKILNQKLNTQKDNDVIIVMYCSYLDDDLFKLHEKHKHKNYKLILMPDEITDLSYIYNHKGYTGLLPISVKKETKTDNIVSTKWSKEYCLFLRPPLKKEEIIDYEEYKTYLKTVLNSIDTKESIFYVFSILPPKDIIDDSQLQFFETEELECCEIISEISKDVLCVYYSSYVADLEEYNKEYFTSYENMYYLDLDHI